MKPGIIIVGAGDTGIQLARRLCDNWLVRVLDIDAAALEHRSLERCEHRHVGDGTSALVLRKAGAGEAHTLVATTDCDETNLEVLRIARQDLGIDNLHTSMHSPEWEERYRALDVHVVDRHLACSALLEARIEGRSVATNVGLGEGEIMEVEVLANSSVIGQRLADLSPRRWLVGAVYRDGELIVPHGDTVIEEGDRVLVIGEPEILSSIATHIGSGESEFPLHYGSRIVALSTPGLSGLLGEAHYLLSSTAAQHFEVIAGPGSVLDDEVIRCCEASGFALDHVNAADATSLGLATAAVYRDVGLLILEPEPLSFLCRIGLRRSQTVQLIDLMSSPVLIARGTYPYEQVLLVLAELPFSMSAAQLAIDLVRMVGSRLVLGVVHQPELVVGSQLREEIDEKRKQVEKLASLYHVEVQVQMMEGNPIDVVVQRSAETNLVVLPYRRRRRSRLTSPDVAQNLMHQVRCSALVMPD